MRPHHRLTTRGGFTLVELLVAMALIIFIMTILSAAFSVAGDTFRQLKAIGDMSEQLRSASTIIRRDLQADHFEDISGDRPPLRDISTGTWDGSRKGFLYVRQDSVLIPAASPGFEGSDADGLQSFRATDHEFGMAVRLSAKTQGDTVSATTTAPVLANLAGSNLLDFAFNPQQMVSRWAEVYYFLRPTSVVTQEVNGTTQQLYTLYRRQRVVAPHAVLLPNTTPGPPVPVQFNPDVVNSTSLALAQVPLPPSPPQPPQFMAVGPESLTASVPANPAVPGVFIPTNRLGGWHDPLRTGYPGPYPAPPPQTGPGPAPATFDWRPYPASGAEYGSDILLNNVVSMRVRIQNDTGAFLNNLPVNLVTPTGAIIYDTARPAPPGGKPQIRALHIQLRIYNTNTGSTRQVSIVQDM